MIEIKDIAINQIEPNPNQPRKQFDDNSLNELADSIRTNGLLEPIVVRPSGEKYKIVCGERRWRASKIAGLETISAIIRECSADESFEISLTENVQRDNLNPIDEALAYQRMIDKGYTQQQIGDVIGKGRTYVAQKLRLLEFPPEICESVSRDTLSEGHARQLLRLKNIFEIDATDENAWKEMAIEIGERAVRKNLTVADVRQEIDKWKEFIDSKEWIRNYANDLAKAKDVDTLNNLRTSLYFLVEKVAKRLQICKV
jgi:ParB family chromosome partitioning protein